MIAWRPPPPLSLRTMRSLSEKLTAFRLLKRTGVKVGMLTAADYPTGRLLDEAGVDFVLVGDSLGMVVLGMVVPGRVVPGTLVGATVVTSAVVVTRVVGTPVVGTLVVDTPGALVVTADSEVLHDGATRVSAVTATGANQGRMAETSRVMVVAAGADGQGRRSSPVTVAVAVGSHEYSKCLYRGKDLH